MRVVLGPFSVNPHTDSDIVQAFEDGNLPEGVSKSKLFRLAMHHWLTTGHLDNGESVDPGTFELLLDGQRQIEQTLDSLLSRLKVGSNTLVIPEPEPAEIDPRLAKAQEALNKLGEL